MLSPVLHAKGDDQIDKILTMANRYFLCHCFCVKGAQRTQVFLYPMPLLLSEYTVVSSDPQCMTKYGLDMTCDAYAHLQVKS